MEHQDAIVACPASITIQDVFHATVQAQEVFRMYVMQLESAHVFQTLLENVAINVVQASINILNAYHAIVILRDLVEYRVMLKGKFERFEII